MLVQVNPAKGNLEWRFSFTNPYVLSSKTHYLMASCKLPSHDDGIRKNFFKVNVVRCLQIFIQRPKPLFNQINQLWCVFLKTECTFRHRSLCDISVVICVSSLLLSFFFLPQNYPRNVILTPSLTEKPRCLLTPPPTIQY